MARFCRYCGTELSDNAVFCKNCGSKIPKAGSIDPYQSGNGNQGAANPAPVFCRYCGSAVTNGKAFCKNCGASLAGGGNSPYNTPDQAPVQNQPYSQTPNQYQTQMYGQPQGQSTQMYDRSGVQQPQNYGQYNRNQWQENNAPYTNVPRRKSFKPIIAAILVLALFVSFVYPGFIRTRMFGGDPGQGNEGKIITPPKKDPDKGNTGNSGKSNPEDDLPTPEELEAEYARIDAAFENGTLFENLNTESDPHPEYTWLYSSEDGWNVSDDSEDSPKQQPKILPCGKSKAFRMETPYGVTISAEENALDKDRTFTLEPVSGELYDQLEDMFVKDIEGPGIILDAWELDAGLEDDEAFSEYFTMELDLDQMGMTEDDYPLLHFYRVDDSGKWHEYASQIEGNKAIIQSNQNSIFLTALGIGYIVYKSPPLINKLIAWRAGAYLNPETGAFPIYYRGKAVMQIMLDRNQFKDILYTKSNEYFDELTNKATKKAFDETIAKYNLGKHKFTETSELKQMTLKMKEDPKTAEEGKAIWDSYLKRYRQLYEDEVKNDPDYVRVQKNLEAYNKAIMEKKKIPPELEQVDKVCEHAVRAWGWLKEELKVQMPKYQLRIELSEASRGSYGVTVYPYKENPYIVIFMEKLGSGTALAYDSLLCTLCHEMFHVVQRGYAWDSMANYKFDEMSAQDVEEMAFDYFSNVATDPIISSKFEVLDNLRNAWYFALPLNDFSTIYPEGEISVSGTNKPDSSYPVAPFLSYLRSTFVKPEKKYPEILNSYGETWKRGKVTYILQTAFGLGDNEKDLTQAYRLFAKRNQARFYLESLKPNINKVFSPIVELNGKKEITLWNKNYTIRVRRAQPKNLVKAGDEYALALKYHDNYSYVMPDFDIEPLNMRRDREYKIYSDGIFIEPRKASEKETVYLMEVDGGTGPAMGDKIWNAKSSGYTLYLMVKPEQPEVAKKGEMLELKLPKLGEEPEKEIVDSYVVTLRTGKTDVLQQQFTREDIKETDVNPVRIDISDLKIKGMKLTEEERKNLVVIIQECVEDTFKTDPCLGPESEPVYIFNDIFGTWDIRSEMIEYNSPFLGGIMTQKGNIMDKLEGKADQKSLDTEKRSVEQYFREEEALSDAITKGNMILSPGKGNDQVEAVMKMEGAPDQFYEGVYDRKTMKLTLNPKNTIYSFDGASKESNAQQNSAHQKIESGTYDLKDFDLAAAIELQFMEETDPQNPDLKKYTFVGSSELNNQLIVFKANIYGKKISDEY